MPEPTDDFLVTCPDCGGHGTDDTDDHSECRACLGAGEIWSTDA